MKLLDFYALADSPEKKLVINNCIALMQIGSFLYGTNTQDSDKDYIGIFIEPLEYKLGRKRIDFIEFKSNPSNSGTRNGKGDLDCTFYSLDKWFGLLQNNNPNQVELLFINSQNLIHSTPLFEKILDNRNIFLSKKCQRSFLGYAYSQIQRNEVKSGNQSGRKDLIAKFGFDPKLCSHALRLYTETISLLTEGEIRFPLWNNKELLDIKKGLYSYEKFQERCKYYEPLIDKAYLESKLQYSPQQEEIHKLQVYCYNKYYNNPFD